MSDNSDCHYTLIKGSPKRHLCGKSLDSEGKCSSGHKCGDTARADLEALYKRYGKEKILELFNKTTS